MSPRVSVNEVVIRWALQRSGKSVDSLTKKQPLKELKKWLSGEKNPTVKQLEVFSTTTSVPFGYLFFSSPPNEQIPIPYFRTHTDSSVTNPSADLIDTIQIIEQRQDWMREYLVADGAEPLDLVGSAKITDPHKETARKIREELSIDQGWASAHPNWSNALSDMKNRVEEAGIFLSTNGVVGTTNTRPLDPKEFRGFVLVDKHAPFIFTNSRDFKAAQMFTLAHELAHVWIGNSAAFDLRYLRPARNAIENACNRIAAEFLVPMESMVQEWAKFSRERNPFQAGARHFKVSEIVMARRALDAHMINLAEFHRFYKKQQDEARDKDEARRKKKTRRGEFYNNAHVRIGKVFMRNVVGAVMEGKLLYREAYNLTGLKRKSFDGMVTHLESGGDIHE